MNGKPPVRRSAGAAPQYPKCPKFWRRLGAEAIGHIGQASRPCMESHPADLLVLKFGIRWVWFGGASAEDIFLTFGCSEARYFARLWVLVTRPGIALDELLARRLVHMCAERLHRTEEPDSVFWPEFVPRGHRIANRSRAGDDRKRVSI